MWSKGIASMALLAAAATVGTQVNHLMYQKGKTAGMRELSDHLLNRESVPLTEVAAPQAACLVSGKCTCGENCSCTTQGECLNQSAPSAPVSEVIQPDTESGGDESAAAQALVATTTQREWLPWYEQRNGQWVYIEHRWTDPGVERISLSPAQNIQYQPGYYQQGPVFYGPQRRWMSSCGPGGCR